MQYSALNHSILPLVYKVLVGGEFSNKAATQRTW